MSTFLRDIFSDKERDGRPWSSGRIVAMLTALTFNVCMLVLAYKGLNIGWPWAVLGIFVLLAVPIQKALGSRKHGPELIKALINRVGIGEVGGQLDPRAPSRFDDERGPAET